MSHVANISTKQIKFDLEIVKELCRRQGWLFMENQKTYAWYGRFVGDAPQAEDVKIEDYGKCDHAIKIPGCSYELGLRVTGNGLYNVIGDFWKGGQLDKVLGAQGEVFGQLYNMTNDIMWAEAKGYSWEEIEAETLGNKKISICVPEVTW